MATGMNAQVAANKAAVQDASSISFERFGGMCAMLAGVAGFLYAVGFVIIPRIAPKSGNLAVIFYSLFLMLGAIFTTAALLALYNHLKQTDGSFALWGLLLGIIGAGGALVHGGYDLGAAINPSANAGSDLPNQVDPRGLLTFGVMSVGLFVMSWLAGRTPNFPKNFAYLGYLSAVLMIILYLGRLIILDANNLALVVPALLAGFIVNPAWYLWLGTLLRKNG